MVEEKAKKTRKKALKEEPKKETTKEDYEKLVVEMAKKGITSEKIGIELAKQGIHTKNQGKKISKILKENKLYVNPDLKNVSDKLERVSKHYDKNRQDKRAKREKNRITSQIKNLRNYFKKRE
ncbi:MAG: hypothetical protein Q7R52_03240 [archaeon]|nr:hypothetical protein [archaeon]